MFPNAKALILLFAAVGVSLSALGAEKPVRQEEILKDSWSVRKLDSGTPDIAALTREAASPGDDWMTAQMPAQVQDVLLSHGKIPDPHFSNNASKLTWVGDSNWAYTRRFRSPERNDGPVYLHFDGLDTVADAYLNGRHIGAYDNMLRRYREDVTEQLAAPGNSNTLVIVFQAPLPYIEAFDQPEEHRGKVLKDKYVRKPHNDYRTYLGARPGFTKIGVFGKVWLDLPGKAWLEDVWARTDLSDDYRHASVRVRVESAGQGGQIHWRLLRPDGMEEHRGSSTAKGDVSEFVIDVTEPQLWWPREHGAQPLYQLVVDLKDGDVLMDSRTTSIGIREIRPVFTDPATGEKRFRFDVNGKPIYFKGGCWPQLDYTTYVWDRERAGRLMDLAEHAGMNIFRVWGPGGQPDNDFYDECDRRGIAVWHDFAFDDGNEPTSHPAYEENIRLEVAGIIRSLRNHPSVLLYAGGNESHMFLNFRGQEFTAGEDLFDEILPELVAKHDGTRLFHKNSPYGGPVPNWPLEGDWHDYTTIQYAPMASAPLWSSEILRVSPPSLGSMKRFLSDEEIWPQDWTATVRKPGTPAWPPAWAYHSTGPGSWDRIGAIETLLEPSTPAELIRVLGTAHGEYLQERVERQRRGVPDGGADGSRRNWGNTVWRFFDPWPMIYSAVVDYYLEPKIPYYYLRRAYDDVLVSFEQTPDWMSVWLINDSAASVDGRLVVRRMGFDGETKGELGVDVSLAPGQSKRCLKLTEFGPLSLHDDFLQATFNGYEAIRLLKSERYLHLPEAHLEVKVTGDVLEIRTDAFAREVALEVRDAVGAVFEDNYFNLAPGTTRRVRIMRRNGGKRLTVQAVNAKAVELAF